MLTGVVIEKESALRGLEYRNQNVCFDVQLGYCETSFRSFPVSSDPDQLKKKCSELCEHLAQEMQEDNISVIHLIFITSLSFKLVYDSL